MMKSVLPAMTTSEAAFKLRLELGPLCDWGMRLADLRRRRYVDGPVLRPLSLFKQAGRIVYLTKTVDMFIAEMRKLNPTTTRLKPPETFDVLAPAFYKHFNSV